MANIAKWNISSTNSATTIMSTTLATVASTTLSVISSGTIVNTSGLDLYSDWELNVGTTAGPFGTAAAAVLYVAPKLDGTNSAEGNVTELEPLCVFPLTTSTSNAQHRVVRRMIPISPVDFNVYLFNNTTQAFSTGSGDNTLKAIVYEVNLNA